MSDSTSPDLAAGRRFTSLVLGTSAFVQLASLGFVGNRVSGGDAHTYLALAPDWSSWTRLTDAAAFEGNFWPAGYSGFLRVMEFFGPNQLLATRCTQIVMVLLIAVLTSSLASVVSLRASRWTLVVVAFSPTLFFAMWSIGYELLLGFLLVLSLWLILRSRKMHWMAVASGLAAGLALLVQFRAVTAVPVLVYLAWRRAPILVATWTAGLAMIVVPWMMRSFLATGSPAPWSGNGAYNLWNGNGPHATGHNVYPLPPIPAGFESHADAAIGWILDNPAAFLELTAKKVAFLFFPTDIAGITDRLPFQGLLTYVQWGYSAAVLLLLIAFVGSLIWVGGSHLNRLMPTFVLMLLYLAPNALLIVEARFRIPVEGLVLAIAASTLDQWIAKRNRTGQRDHEPWPSTTGAPACEVPERH